jgi:hypothetical protein
LDILLPSLPIVLDYLSHLFNIGFSTASLNTHRSMLSLTVDPIEGHNVVENPLVVQLLKGCYNFKLPKPCTILFGTQIMSLGGQFRILYFRNV